MTPRIKDIPLRYGTYALLGWSALMVLLMYLGFMEEYSEVPTTVNYTIVLPFISIEGALWLNMVYLLWRKDPNVKEVAICSYLGAILFLIIRYFSLDLSDGIILSSVVVGFPLIALCVMKTKRSIMRIVGATSWVIFFCFALYTHLGLIFQIAHEVDRQRASVVTTVLTSQAPLMQGTCSEPHFTCVPFSLDMDWKSLGIPESGWEGMKSVWQHHPIYEPQLLKITDEHALNRTADYNLVGMMSHGDQMVVAVSKVPHLLEWRILGNRYMLTSISIAYLAWGGLFFAIGLFHTYKFSLRRAKLNIGAKN